VGAIMERRGKSFPHTYTFFGDANMENEIIKLNIARRKKLLK